jgi:hypothetical protein
MKSFDSTAEAVASEPSSAMARLRSCQGSVRFAHPIQFERRGSFRLQLPLVRPIQFERRGSFRLQLPLVRPIQFERWGSFRVSSCLHSSIPTPYREA